MTHSGKLCAMSTALLMFTVSGCAGNGLRNMFSRNETGGYKTLEELEAEEAKAAESDSAIADADADSSRFASWLPFGKKSDAESEAIAAAEAASAEEKTETEGAGWWQNPFRRHEAAETDPFLTQDDGQQDDGQSEAVAKNEKPAFRKKPLVQTAGDKELFARDDSASDKPDESKENKDQKGSRSKAVRTVSGTSETEVSSDDDEMLVQKFEQQFQETTVATAEAAEDAEPLIVAGKQKGQNSTKAGMQEEEKLAELERLLAATQSPAGKQKRPEASSAKRLPYPSEVAEEMLATTKQQESVKQQPAGIARTQINRAADSFDNFLAETPQRVAVPQQPSMSGNASRSGRPATPDSTDIEVAGPGSLFGRPVASSMAKDTLPGSGGAATGGWSGEAAEHAFQWAQSRTGDSTKGSSRTGRVLHSVAEQFSQQFTERPGNLPVVAAPDTPDPGFVVPVDSVDPASRRNSVSKANLMRTVSSGRELPTTATPDGLTEDPFFADSPVPEANDAVVAVSQETQATEPRDSAPGPGWLASLKGRHWLLLMGGIIVVALLFAPARKKTVQANQAPIQG